MFNENSVSLIGNAGKVEVKRTNGTAYAIINLATNERWTDEKGNKAERAEWHRVVTFRPKLVDLIEKAVKKGDFLRITGKLRTNSFERAGETVYSTEVHIDRLGFLSPKDTSAEDTDDQA